MLQLILLKEDDNKMNTVKYIYLRNDVGHPVAVVAYTMTQELVYGQMITKYHLGSAAWNQNDVYDRALGRDIALARLNKAPIVATKYGIDESHRHFIFSTVLANRKLPKKYKRFVNELRYCYNADYWGGDAKGLSSDILLKMCEPY